MPLTTMIETKAEKVRAHLNESSTIRADICDIAYQVLLNEVVDMSATKVLFPTHSSMMESYSYQRIAKALIIKLKNDKAFFVYFGITPKVFEEFHSATSKGKYYNECIRERYHSLKYLPQTYPPDAAA